MAFPQSHADQASSSPDTAHNDCDGKALPAPTVPAPTVPVSYRVGHVAKLLGVSRRTVERWCTSGQLPAMRPTPRGHWRILTEGLQRKYHQLVAEVPAANDSDDDEI